MLVCEIAGSTPGEIDQVNLIVDLIEEYLEFETCAVVSINVRQNIILYTIRYENINVGVNMSLWHYISIENVISLILILIFIFISIAIYYYLKRKLGFSICGYLEDNKIRIILITSIIITLIFINVVIWIPRTILINGPNDEPSFIPPFVIVFSVIGALMYFFASTVSEWIEVKKLKTDINKLEAFNEMTFCNKLKEFDLERKILRVIAAPLMAIGIYLLFDLILFDSNITTERQVSNVSLMNSTMQDLIKEIEATNKIEKLIEIKAGISFLAGAFVKQFLDLTRSLAEKIVKRNN